MANDSSRGPPVDATETLYRGISCKQWWDAIAQSPTSGAFRHDVFSVDVASKTTSHQDTLAHLPPGSGLVAFNCGEARALGFDARDEIDQESPENQAHANVYCDLPTKQKLRAAQKLKLKCQVIQPSMGRNAVPGTFQAPF